MSLAASHPLADIPLSVLADAPRVWADLGSGRRVRQISPKFVADFRSNTVLAKALIREAEAKAREAQREAERTEEERLLEEVRKAIRSRASQIIAEVAAEHRIDPREITGPRRDRPIVDARFHAIYEIRRQCPALSLPQIGRRFGGRDHTTILNAIHRWPERAAELGIAFEPIATPEAA